MHTALISLVLMCGTCGDASDQTPPAAQPAVVSRELPAGHTAAMKLEHSETAKHSNYGWQQR